MPEINLWSCRRDASPSWSGYERPGGYFPCAVFLAAVILFSGCDDIFGRNIEGKWDYASYSSVYTSTEMGTIDFKPDGRFELDVTNTSTGRRKGGGDYTHQEQTDGEGKILRLHVTWAEYEGGSRQDFDGYTFSGKVSGGSGSFILEEETANIWTIKISR